MQKTTLQYCRVQAAPGAGGRRQQLQRRIRRQSFLIPGLPPSAILLIRKCGLALNRQGGPGRNADFLRQAAAKAARPENGFIPGNAPAILFRNRAEAIAFLADDFLKPGHRKKWWWQALLNSKTLPGIDDIAGLYLRHAESAPAALRHLLAWKSLVPFAASLDKTSAQKLLYGMLQKHHACDFLQRIDWELDLSGSTPPRHAAAQALLHRFWRQHLPETDLHGAGSYYQTLLAGVGLLLAQQPGLLHHREFCRRFERQQTALQAMLEEDREPPLLGLDDDSDPNGSVGISPGSAQGEMVRSAAGQRVHQLENSGGKKPAENFMDGASGDDGDGTIKTQSSATKSTAGWQLRTEGKSDRDSGARSDGTDPAADRHGFTGLSGLEICTELGGLFFLLPLLRRLDLFQWYGGPFSCLSEIRPWERLELLGESLLQEKFITCQGDPVWRLLALLDDREAGESAGDRICVTHDYLLLPDWLQHFPADANTWTAQFDGRYLKVIHPAGFTAADLCCSPEELPEKCRVVNAAFNLTLDWRRLETTATPLSAGEPPINESRRWAAFMRPFLCQLIAGIFPNGTMPEADAVKRLFCQTADIYYYEPHLDIVFPLESSDIAIRKAGLDANPGWLPELGLVVTFYFR